MARYNRASGPPADFELTAAFQDVTGLSITRSWDDGEVLISFTTSISNGTGLLVETDVRVLIDGQVQNLLFQSTTTPAGQFNTLTATAFLPLSEGSHTIKLQAGGNAAVGDVLLAGFTNLTVIQLPLWDSQAGII